MLLTLRSALYMVALIVTVIPYAIACLLWAPFLSVHRRYRLTIGWPKLAIFFARWILGIRWEVEGWDNLPDSPAIILPKHQSAWETLWLPSYMPRDLTFVYKRELHRVPFFGWGLGLLKMINIDRSRGQVAFEQVVEQGREKLAEGRWIVIFPEGTRTPPGSLKRYKTGGARLAVRTGAVVVPIALNSGECWPRHAFIKRPGLIRIVICKPISPVGKTADELAALVESAIETEMRRLAPHRYRGPYVSPQRQPSAA
ncbi:MAG TPA: lysophospholipid acyltransferase family protein [Burkholderiaceae bacterium]|nr:lysophospholipid acyltransferase family protein [Burkholderiaceae bacterium]